ncbi:hypothetical protein [Croceicoccus bisphenolivorans]|uniref:hypothetical protein n=1 Tax=Croceicoccus bisphenolivorans TaxID=1783232 RepID=UPI0008361046|nr:hypothetical protein [Croceicoccus bisphenolivorans]
MRRILSLFRREPPAAAPVDETLVEVEPTPPIDPRAPILLPVTVLDAIDAAHITPRFGKDYDEPRFIVAFPGINPWLYSGGDDGARKFFERIFPELSDEQLSKAVQRLEFRIAAAATNWITNSQQAPRSARIGGVQWDDKPRVIGAW